MTNLKLSAKNDAKTTTTSRLPSIFYTNQYYNKTSHNLDLKPPCDLWWWSWHHFLHKVSDLSLLLPNAVTVGKCPPLLPIQCVSSVLHVVWLWIPNYGPEAETQIGYIEAEGRH